jgi:hypothetical protein
VINGPDYLVLCHGVPSGGARRLAALFTHAPHWI